MTPLKNIDSVKSLRCKIADKNIFAGNNAGVYRWWFKKGTISSLPQNCNIEEQNIDGEIYQALYFGISKKLYSRIKWHITQNHTPSSVKSGILSTLRQTISAILHKNMTQSQDCVNKFIDKNCYLEWEDSINYQQAKAIETEELQNTTYNYPLNISENKSTPKIFITTLKKLRKKYKK